MQADAQARLDVWSAAVAFDTDERMLIVKPADGGSTIGVSAHRGLAAATAAAHKLFASSPTTEVVIEPKLLGCIEFTCVVVGTKNGPVALAPSTIEMVDYAADIRDAERTLAYEAASTQIGQWMEPDTLVDDEDAASIFSFRRKYLNSNSVRTHTPPMMPAGIVQVRRSSCY